MAPRVSRRSVMGALACGAVLVALCAGPLDRQASTLAFIVFHPRRAWFDALTQLVDPLLPLSTLTLVMASIAAGAGWRPSKAAQVAITASIALVLAVTFKEQAKYAFGRLWPETWVDNNPSWIGTGSYGFYPFHGGRGWASFPSGHMAVIVAPATVLWKVAPTLRAVAAGSVAAVAIGLYGANYHFPGDIVAGFVLGLACGSGALAMVSLNWRFDVVRTGSGKVIDADEAPQAEPAQSR